MVKNKMIQQEESSFTRRSSGKGGSPSISGEVVDADNSAVARDDAQEWTVEVDANTIEGVCWARESLQESGQAGRGRFALLTRDARLDEPANIGIHSMPSKCTFQP